MYGWICPNSSQKDFVFWCHCTYICLHWESTASIIRLLSRRCIELICRWTAMDAEQEQVQLYMERCVWATAWQDTAVYTIQSVFRRYLAVSRPRHSNAPLSIRLSPLEIFIYADRPVRGITHAEPAWENTETRTSVNYRHQKLVICMINVCPFVHSSQVLDSARSKLKASQQQKTSYP